MAMMVVATNFARGMAWRCFMTCKKQYIAVQNGQNIKTFSVRKTLLDLKKIVREQTLTCSLLRSSGRTKCNCAIRAHARGHVSNKFNHHCCACTYALKMNNV